MLVHPLSVAVLPCPTRKRLGVPAFDDARKTRRPNCIDVPPRIVAAPNRDLAPTLDPVYASMRAAVSSAPTTSLSAA